MDIDSWQQKQKIMATDLEVTNVRKIIWFYEELFTEAWRKGLVLNLGSGNSPIECDIAVDPLNSRDVKCVGEFLPFRNKSFDTVLIYSVLDHVLSDSKVLEESLRVLKPNGRILIMQSVREIKILFRILWQYFIRRNYKPDPNHLRHYYGDIAFKLFLEKYGTILKYWIISKIVFGSRCVFVCIQK